MQAVQASSTEISGAIRDLADRSTQIVSLVETISGTA